MEDVAEWFDDALGQIVWSRATAAASIFETNKYNVMHLVKMALRAKRDATAARTGTKSVRTELDQHAEKIVATLDWGPAERTPPVVDETARLTRPLLLSRELKNNWRWCRRGYIYADGNLKQVLCGERPLSCFPICGCKRSLGPDAAGRGRSTTSGPVHAAGAYQQGPGIGIGPD